MTKIAPIRATVLAQRLLAALPIEILRGVRRRTEEIQQHRREWSGRSPKMAMEIDDHHHLPGVRKCSLHWTCGPDGSDMILKARVTVGRNEDVLSVSGNKGTLHAVLPQATLMGISRQSLRSIVDHPLLEGYLVYKVTSTVHLQEPAGLAYVTTLLDEIEPDEMTALELCRSLRDTGFTALDRVAWKLAERASEKRAIVGRLQRMLTGGDNHSIAIGDIVRLTGANAKAWLTVRKSESGRMLSAHYASDPVSYRDGVVSFSHSSRFGWRDREQGLLRHIPEKPVSSHGGHFRTKRISHPIEHVMDRLERGETVW